jgi:hypothetical protein
MPLLEERALELTKAILFFTTVQPGSQRFTFDQTTNMSHRVLADQLANFVGTERELKVAREDLVS